MIKSSVSMKICLILVGVVATPIGTALAHQTAAMLTPTEFDESAGKVGMTFTSWCRNEIEMRYETQDKTAVAGQDYSTVKGVMSLSYGSPHNFELPVLQDSAIEGYESLTLVILGVPGGGGGSGYGNDICLGGGPESSRSDTFNLTIVDDDIPAEKNATEAGSPSRSAPSSASKLQQPVTRANGPAAADSISNPVVVIPPSPEVSKEVSTQASGGEGRSSSAKGAGAAIVILGAVTLLAVGVALASRARSVNG